MVTGERRIILFTAFEPSGDALAQPMIQQLRQLRPDLEIWALGGPRMRVAGANLIESTTGSAAMGLGAIAQARLHFQRLRRLSDFLAHHEVAALVAVDSPAANWSICKRVRRMQPAAKVVHLAAPQLWAWAPWRIAKLRRLTDRVLCLFPFEPAWFTRRGVEAVFVGHPLFDRSVGLEQSSQGPVVVPAQGDPKIALLPGSRVGEVRANWPTMLRAFDIVRLTYPDARGLVAAADEQIAGLVGQMPAARGLDRGHGVIAVETGRTAAVLAWADVVLTVSGTATLQCAAHRKPMVVLYNVARWFWWLAGWWLVRTRTFSLPNLIMQSLGHTAVVPELVPHHGAAQPVAGELGRLISDPLARDRQILAFDRIARSFAGSSFSLAAARQLLGVLGDPVR